MNIFRKFILFTAYSLLPAALLTFGALFSIHQVFGSPGHIKSALDNSDIYGSVAAGLIQENTGNVAAASGEQQAVQKAVQESVPPEYLKEQTNKVLDGVFAWLQGDSKQLSFSVDLTPVKTNLVDSLARQAKSRAETLPTCSTESDVNLTGDDPFSIDCLPPGINPDMVANRAREQVLASDIFKESNITPETISKDQGQSLQDQLQPAARIYQSVWQGVLVSGISSILLTAAVIALSRPWQNGAKRTALIFLSIGISNVLLGLVAAWGTKAIADKIAEDGTALQAKLAEVVRLLSNDLRGWWVGFGLLLTGLGIAGLIIIRTKKFAPVPVAAGQGTDGEPINTLPVEPAEHKNNQIGGPTITN